jgi:CheY-like chemotaxis protein
MVVDDDETVLTFAAHVLEAVGHEVEVVHALGEEAVEACARAASTRPPAVLVVDLRMPPDTGVLVARLRAELPRLRVVLCTGEPVGDEERARVGADALLKKPFLSADLLRALRGAPAPDG